FFSSRRRHTRFSRDWSSDVCSSDLAALGGVLVTGALLALLGLLVTRIGTAWIGKLMPPVVMGSIVALIGFNLAPTAYENFKQSEIGRASCRERVERQQLGLKGEYTR